MDRFLAAGEAEAESDDMLMGKDADSMGWKQVGKVAADLAAAERTNELENQRSGAKGVMDRFHCTL